MDGETVNADRGCFSWCCWCCPCFKTRKKQHQPLVEEQSSSMNSEDAAPLITDLKTLTVGSITTVEGFIQKKCKRFSINFICSKTPNPDIAFHFNPRMEQRYVVRNCRSNGYWGEEETSSVMPFDFHKEKDFKVDFFTAEREFLVSINGNHWCSFTYRMPLISIVALEVRGFIEMKNVNVRTIRCYPEDAFSCIPIKIGDNTKKEYKLPFIGKLPQYLTAGWEIDIMGKPKLLPQTFYINLQEAPQLWPHPNISLHLNPRFCAMNGVDVFVRNAWYQGEWGPEERAPVCPFLAGNEFLIQIRHEYEAFTVWSSDKLIAEFRFRCPVDKILYIHIAGDLELCNVSLHQRDRASQSLPMIGVPKSTKFIRK